jgi:hypothetical protein
MGKPVNRFNRQLNRFTGLGVYIYKPLNRFKRFKPLTRVNKPVYRFKLLNQIIFVLMRKRRLGTPPPIRTAGQTTRVVIAHYNYTTPPLRFARYVVV